jgi:hypothetical protein
MLRPCRPAFVLRLLGAAVALNFGLLPGLGAQEAAWEPPPPMPDDFDWLQLYSGEWLKGELKVVYQDTVEFDSAEMDLVTFDLADIRMIRSAQVISLRVRDGRTAVGKLLLDGDALIVVGDGGQSVLTREDLLTVTAGVPRERNYWTGDITMGGNVRSGNTQQIDASTEIRLQRRTVEGRLVIDHLGSYTSTGGVQTSSNQRGSVTWDRFRSEKVFIRPLFGEYFKDPFQNILRRYTIGTGAGYQLVDSSRTDWSVSLGPAYQGTRYEQVEPGLSDSEGSWALSAGTVYSTDFTNRIEFDYDYQFQLTSKEAGTYNHHMTAGLSFELTSLLDFDVSVVWDRIREPKANSDGTIPEPDDFRVSLGIRYEF